uniref:D-beta-hydroxybutyrate dehydrogenase, mitochondrial n=1 Tax=Magallana gigas TaxID=29159 RepID=K1RCJ3_MAGGI
MSVLILYVILRIIQSRYKKLLPVKSKAVLVTGCDRGFGHHFARHLDDVGFTVYAGVLHKDSAGAKKLKSHSSKRLHVLQLDVTCDSDIKEAVAFITAHSKNKGRIVNISSVMGRYSAQGDSAYHMSKSALESVSDSLRLEMRPCGVGVSIIEPGKFDAATTCNDPEIVKIRRNEVDIQWERATEEVKSFYGKDYFYRFFLKDNRENSAESPDKVIEAVVDALLNEAPRARYLVPGSSRLIDIHAIFARLNGYFPEIISDVVLWSSLCHLDDVGFTVFAGVLHKDSAGAKKLKSRSSKRLHVLQLDVTCDSDIKEAVAFITAHSKNRGLWGVVNNAGVNVVGDMEKTPIYQINRCLSINLFGMIRVKIRRDEVDIQWERATEEVKSFYGKDYFNLFFLKDNRENSAESPDKLIEAVVDALLNEAPRARYLVPGSSRLQKF